MQNISHSESERRADELFTTVSPWCDITDRSRFGVSCLVSDLSKLLIQLIEETLVQFDPLITPPLLTLF